MVNSFDFLLDITGMINILQEAINILHEEINSNWLRNNA